MHNDIKDRLGRIVAELDEIDSDVRRSNVKSKAVKKAMFAVMDARDEITRLAVGEMVNAAAHDPQVVGESNVITGPIPYHQLRGRLAA